MVTSKQRPSDRVTKNCQLVPSTRVPAPASRRAGPPDEAPCAAPTFPSLGCPLGDAGAPDAADPPGVVAAAPPEFDIDDAVEERSCAASVPRRARLEPQELVATIARTASRAAAAGFRLRMRQPNQRRELGAVRLDARRRAIWPFDGGVGRIVQRQAIREPEVEESPSGTNATRRRRDGVCIDRSRRAAVRCDVRASIRCAAPLRCHLYGGHILAAPGRSAIRQDSGISGLGMGEHDVQYRRCGPAVTGIRRRGGRLRQ